MRERTAQGEVLLQFTDMPYDSNASQKRFEMYKSRKFTPHIEVSDYRKRYFDILETSNYDEIALDFLMKTHFLHWVWDSFAEKEKNIIKNYISSLNGRIYSTLAKNAKSVIEFGNTDYDKYCELKEKGYKVYHSFYVIDYINKHRRCI